MKNIQVSDEMYDSLVALSKEINSQDHLATAMPYIFQVQEEKEVPAFNGCGDIITIAKADLEIEFIEGDEEDMIEFILENCQDELKESYIAEDELKEFCFHELSDFLYIYKDFDFFELEKRHEYSNMFFTKKSCDEHIERNNYHYKNPKSYLNYAFRNPELELIYKFLCELTGGKIHK